ncbi:MAG: cyclic nucleotide-binding domain-containing protein [Sphingobium sp.]|jgi:CRP/FNR family transcriptional regulator|nr:cyclic nucleotide-binding domain-containing protein [Sphingobium sp.]MCI1272011.1 cyclic nucleotide-binding domain-containing protein [Sphingobium sp.]MCI2052226.1 cyclic nucleotide-binding domain-containing protein [Sphingobium sp.]
MTKRALLQDDHPCRDCSVSTESLCCALDADALSDFRNQGGTICLAAGEPLFHQGDLADCVFSVTSGVVKLNAILPDGRRQVVTFLFPGDFVGLEMNDRHEFSAEAVSDTRLCRFLKGRFERFADRYPALAAARYRRAASELASAHQKIVMLGRKTAAERLASFLTDVHRRIGTAEVSGAKLVPLPMSRGDIADYLGLTKETVSREFTRLRTSRIIRPRSVTLVEILDPQRMRELAFGIAA